MPTGRHGSLHATVNIAARPSATFSPRRVAISHSLPLECEEGEANRRLVINGSFVTDVLEPNDVDFVVLIGAGFPQDKAAEAELVAGLPFLELSLIHVHSPPGYL
ncbi:MAG: hypothetical protein ACC628_23135 [Pirellulaceae bacterium]